MARHKPPHIDRAAAAEIRAELNRDSAARARISDSRLMAVLDELGVPVSRDLRGVPPDIYALLHFDSLAAAEATLQRLHERLRQAVRTGDEQTAEDCRNAALLMRDRCELIARNLRTVPGKRDESEEIAGWCEMWFQAPDFFFVWLALRRQAQASLRLVDRPGNAK